MKNERILNALGGANDKYIDEAAPVKSVKKAAFEEDEAQGIAVTVTGKRRGFAGWVAAAAGLCIAVGGLAVLGVLGSGNPLTEGGQSQDVDLTKEEADAEVSVNVNHPVSRLSREELYTNMWTMYVPRVLPENYRLAEDAVYEPSDFADCGTIYIKLTDGNNPISYTVYADSLLYDTLGSDSALKRDMSISDMPKLKENGWIDCDNSTVKIKVDIEQPELISDEELYRFVTSAPFADNFADSGIVTADLSRFIDSNYLPVVEFEPYYDVERYTLSGEVFDGTYSIVGFDGTYVYFNQWSHEDENDNQLPDDNGRFITSIGCYNIKTDETVFLPEKGYDGVLNYLYSDGEYVYCSKQTLKGETEYRLVRYEIAGGREETVLDLGNSAWLLDTIVNGNSMFIYVSFLEEPGIKLLYWDMASGVLNTEVKSAEELAPAFTYIDTEDYSWDVTLPYKDGVVYVTVPEDKGPDFIATSCFLFYWDGKSDPVPLFEARLEDIIDINGERKCFSDGEIIYFVHDTYVNGNDDTDGMQDTLCAYDLSNAFAGFDFPMEHILAFNKNLNDSPYHEWHATAASCGDGMTAIDPYSGLIYDAENGWFTYVDTDVYYRAVRNNSSLDAMAMLEYADVEYDADVDFVDYPEGGKDLTLCVITRK